MRKVLVLLLIGVVMMAALFLLGGCGAGGEKAETHVMQDEAASQKAYRRLLLFLDTDGKEYREYYGGAFLNEYKELVICWKKSSKKTEKAMLDAVDYAGARTLSCRFSYDDLETVCNTLQEKQKADPFPYLAGYTLMVRENYVEVRLSDDSSQVRKDFKAWVGKDLAKMITIVFGT